MTWVAPRIANGRNAGGTYTAKLWRLVIHTTEVVPSSVNGAIAMAARHEYPPHLWAWPEQDWLGQTVPLDRSAFALRQPSGSPPTNKAGALQVEVIGHAATMHAKPTWFWEWLGMRLVRPILAAGYVLDLDQIGATTGNQGYGLDGTVRMTWPQWAGFGGICGHANVPGNTHWDPGAAPLHLIADAAKESTMTMKPMPTWVQPAADAGIVKNAESDWDSPPSKGELAVMLERTARYAAKLTDTAITEEAIEQALAALAETVAGLGGAGGNGPSTSQVQDAMRVVLIEQLSRARLVLPGDDG